MTDVFISYARKDQPVARWLAESLQRDGWDVWWDPEMLSGERFEETIRILRQPFLRTIVAAFSCVVC